MIDSLCLHAIANAFIESARRDAFNGVVASALLRLQANPEKLRAELSALIQDEKITAVFSCLSVNMHIKRLPDLPIEEQLKLLTDEPLEASCLYPTASAVQACVDLSAWQDRPFSKALLLAESQLSFPAFDMGALERYVADPRYIVHFADYMGGMSITDAYFIDAQHPERDKVSLQTFGLGFDDQRNPYVIVYLRYLANLSAEHQQYWNSYLADGDVRMSEPYFRSSIKGEFWTNRSVRYAISEEMRLVRELTEAIWGRSLFRAPPKGDVPIGLTSFLRPTTENFNRFVMALDKLLSDSIDMKFFDGKIQLETETTRPDGRIIVQNKGTLALLEEWLLQEITWSDPDAFREVVIQPLRKVRRLRQTPAHTFTKDTFSTEYHNTRKQLLWDVFNSLSNIRATLAKHPRAYHVQIPDGSTMAASTSSEVEKAITTMKKRTTVAKEATGGASPSQLIDARIAELRDWRGATLARVRALIKQADPEVVETWKWRGVPVWEHDGIICTGETYKAVVKLTFAKGAALKDPSGLFNASLDGNVRRAIDIREGDKIDAKALQALVRAAVALNTSKRAAARPVRSRKRPKSEA